MKRCYYHVVPVDDHEMARGLTGQVVIDEAAAEVPFPGRAIQIGGGQAGQDGAVAF